MSSMLNGSTPMNRSRKASKTPSTASAHPSRLASPQPTAPSSLSTRTNSQRGGAKKVSIRPILRSVTLGLVRLRTARGELSAGNILFVMFGELLDRHHQAHARRRKHVPPVGDQLLVG